MALGVGPPVVVVVVRLATEVAVFRLPVLVDPQEEVMVVEAPIVVVLGTPVVDDALVTLALAPDASFTLPLLLALPVVLTVLFILLLFKNSPISSSSRSS